MSNIHEAAARRDLARVRQCLRGGWFTKAADVNERDHRGRTPLHCAVEGWVQMGDVAGESCEVVDYLVRAGADVNARDEAGLTPLHITAVPQTSHAWHLFLQLAEAGADVNPLDLEGRSPLALRWLASRDGRFEWECERHLAVGARASAEMLCGEISVSQALYEFRGNPRRVLVDALDEAALVEIISVCDDRWRRAASKSPQTGPSERETADAAELRNMAHVKLCRLRSLPEETCGLMEIMLNGYYSGELPTLFWYTLFRVPHLCGASATAALASHKYPEVVQALLWELEDDTEVFSCPARAIGPLGEQGDPRAIPYLMPIALGERHVNDLDLISSQRRAAVALLKLGARDHIDQLVSFGLVHPNETVERMIEEALFAHRNGTRPEYVAILHELRELADVMCVRLLVSDVSGYATDFLVNATLRFFGRPILEAMEQEREIRPELYERIRDRLDSALAMSEDDDPEAFIKAW